MFDIPEESKTILYNTLYGSLILLEKSEKEEALKIFGNAQNPCFLDNNDVCTVLLDQKFIVNDEIDEFAIINNRKSMGISDPNRLDVILIPTLDCNFTCKYCYEDHVPSQMSDNTENSLVKWLENEIPKFKFVLIHWFGGEPLLKLNKVLSISKKIQHIADKHDVTLSNQITTNGYLLSKNCIKKLTDSGIFNYQITLDGSKRHHDTLRVLKSGKPTFDIIFKNIVTLAEFNENIKISLRVNFNHTNFESITELLTLFPDNIRKQLRVVFEPIFGNCTINAVDNIDNEALSQSLAGYYLIAQKSGYDIVFGLSHTYTGKLVNCYAERINQYIVNYNGDIYKCSVNKFTGGDRVGYIDAVGEFIKEPGTYTKWIQLDHFEEKCLKCQYLPLCMGGCKKMRIENQSTGSICNLVPTNTSFLLKQIAVSGLNNHLIKEVQ